MSTNYTGLLTAVQTPATAPDPVTAPIVKLPASGDGDTAASVIQALKVLADYIAWEKSPRAKVSSWIQAIKAYKNAKLQTRFAIDHLGFPAGKLVQWDEDWGNLSTFSYFVPTTVLPLTGTRWQIKIDTSGQILLSSTAAAQVIDPSLLTPQMDLFTNTGLGVGANTLTTLNPAITTTADVACSYQWDGILIASNTADFVNTEFDMGLVDTAFPGAGVFSSLGITGAAFVKRTGDTHWFAYTKDPAGGAVYTDTGVTVAVASKFRMRIEVIGANASDTGLAQVIFYLNGALVAQVASAPTLGKSLYPWHRTNRTAVGAGILNLCIGQSAFRANLWPGDVLF